MEIFRASKINRLIQAGASSKNWVVYRECTENNYEFDRTRTPITNLEIIPVIAMNSQHLHQTTLHGCILQAALDVCQ